MQNSENEPTRSLFDHPEAKSSLKLLIGGLEDESDRGAVLVATSEVDNHMRRLFEHIGRASMDKNDLARLLENAGPLSSLSSRADVALLMRIISKQLFHAIRHLRKLRNSVAHSPRAFSLADHQAHIRMIFEVGDGVPGWVKAGTINYLDVNFIASALKIPDPSNPDIPAFKDRQAFLDYVARKPELVSPLEAKRPRVELALGTGLLCAMIVEFRERAIRRLDSSAV